MNTLVCCIFVLFHTECHFFRLSILVKRVILIRMETMFHLYNACLFGNPLLSYVLRFYVG